LVLPGQQGGAVTIGGQAAATGVAYVGAGETLRQAGHRMRDLGVGALRVRADSGRLLGIVPRDMLVGYIAAGSDPKLATIAEIVTARVRGSG
jgi:CBS domain-containing protein